MPNYCKNKITLSGDPKEVKKAFSFMAGTQTPLDFNKIIPYPKEFEEKDKEFETLGWDGYKAKYGNLDAGFGAGGRDWCVQNWGTKWNAIEPIRTGDSISFQTAWSPPTPIIEKIHANNPQIGIKYTYNEPGMCFAGVQVFQPLSDDTEPAGKPTQDHYWEGEGYAELYPDQSLKYAFEGALFEPKNPSNHPTRDQLTKREEETTVAAIKKLAASLVNGCFHTEVGPADEESVRLKLTKLGDTLKVLIDDKFETEIRDVIEAVATAWRGELIEKETSKMTTEDNSKKTTKKKTVVPETNLLTLEQAKKKALERALEDKDAGKEPDGFTLMAMMNDLTEDDAAAFMDYLTSKEFEDLVQEHGPKIGDLSEDDLRKHIEAYRAITPYNKNNPGEFFQFRMNAAAFGVAIGSTGYSLDDETLQDYIIEQHLPYDAKLLDDYGQFVLPENARGVMTKGEGPAKRHEARTKWGLFDILVRRHADQIPEDLQMDLQSSLLRTVLGMDNYPRIGDSQYSEKQFQVRDIVSNRHDVYTYSSVCEIWTGFLRSYKFMLQRYAMFKKEMRCTEAIGAFLATGKLSAALIEDMKIVEANCWGMFITDRIFNALKEYVDGE